MKYKNVGLIHAIAICIVVFNVMACSNGDNKVLQADGKESIQSSIAKVSHIAEGIEKTYEQSIQRKCMDNNRDDYSDQVLIEKVDRSVYDEQGRLIAQIYYDKPVIQGDSEAVKKINTYFEKEAEAFYDRGTGISWLSQINFYEDFKNGMELMKERWGNEMLSQHPTHYTMDTSVCYMDEDMISIVQVWNYNLEHNDWYCYGSTFDLQTGELIPITKLVNIKPEGMKEIFLSVAYEEAEEYEVLKGDNYVIDDYGHCVDMKYQYFYDENFII